MRRSTATNQTLVILAGFHALLTSRLRAAIRFPAAIEHFNPSLLPQAQRFLHTTTSELWKRATRETTGLQRALFVTEALMVARWVRNGRIQVDAGDTAAKSGGTRCSSRKHLNFSRWQCTGF